MQILTVYGRNAGPLVEWLEAEIAGGVRLFILEGFMGSGKSTLARAVAQLLPTISIVEMDNFLNASGGRVAWLDSIRGSDAQTAVRDLLRTGPVLVEGAIVSATLRDLAGDVPSRRLFLKRMQAPGLWADDLQLRQWMPRQVFRSSVRDYLVSEGLGECADLIVESYPSGDRLN